MVGKGSEIRQESETEQSGGKDTGEEHGVSTEKYAAKRGLGRRILWRKRGTDYMEARRPE